MLLFVGATQAEVYQSNEKRLNLLELYTSEGCSSCPPAEKWLANMYSNGFSPQAVVPLAFHVTYWDYLGWKDRFSQPMFDQRQRSIVSREGGRTVYTPQFFVNGGTIKNPDLLTQYLTTRNKFAAKVKIMADLQQTEGSSTVKVTLGEKGDKLLASQPIQVYAAHYQNNLVSEIEAGENRGLKSTHQYVVQSMKTARYKGEALSYSFNSLSGDSAEGGLVIFAERGGEVLQVLHIPLKKRA
jgi:hypothetical protein